MIDRRWMMSRSFGVAAALVGAGLLPRTALAAWNTAAFDAKAMAEWIKAMGASGAAIESKDVTLTGPDIAENGAVVPVGVSTTLPNVKHLAVLVEKNPYLAAAVFDVTPAVEPSFKTRIKMGQTSNVIAAAIAADGKVYTSAKEIKVTLGGCGG